MGGVWGWGWGVGVVVAVGVGFHYWKRREEERCTLEYQYFFSSWHRF